MMFEAIGTSWKIDFFQEVSDSDLALLQKSIFDRIEVFDQTYSRFREDSLVTNMSREAGIYCLPKDAEPMLALYRDLYRLTDGLFTPLIGQVLVDAGYDAQYSLKPGVLRVPPPWEEVISFDAPNMTVKQPVLLDFGAAGKGYLVDIVSDVIMKEGIARFCVDAGGDMVVRGEPMRVALEDPRDTSKAIGIASIQNQSICGSAGSRRKWANFHHTINPKTLSSPTEVIATWVIANSGLLADALATCLFFVPAEQLQKVYTFDYVVLYANGRAERSVTAPVELFS